LGIEALALLRELSAVGGRRLLAVLRAVDDRADALTHSLDQRSDAFEGRFDDAGDSVSEIREKSHFSRASWLLGRHRTVRAIAELLWFLRRTIIALPDSGTAARSLDSLVMSRWALLGIVAIGCGDGLSVELKVEPARGTAPLDARITATAKAKKESATFTYRFDFDGDGTFDTEPSSEASVEHQFAEAGAYAIGVEVAFDGNTKQATAMVEVLPNQPPAAKLDVSPLMGRQPLEVTLDASGSVDPEGEPNPLEARFDFDGDGTFDTEFGSVGPVTHTYATEGTFTPKAEVRDWRGGTAIADGPPLTILPGVDLDVDADRDGAITDADEAFEDGFSAQGGAIFLANVDDDDADARQDWRDAVVSGLDDMRDLARATVSQYPDLPANAEVKVSVGAGLEHVRIFVERDGAVSELMAPTQNEGLLDAASVAAGDVQLFVEGISTRTGDWDGTLELTLSVTIPNEATQSDRVVLRVSPVLFPDNTLPAKILYAMRITEFGLGPNLEFFDVLRDLVPSEVEIYDVDQYTYVGDRWVQDNMQTGYQVMPTESGPFVMQTYLETVRSTGADGLEYFVTRERIGQDYGYAFSGGQETSLNYGGNLEITPPFGEYPFGRVLAGGGNGGSLRGNPYEDHMAPEQRALLGAQAQGEVIELTSEWLYVGHLDEIFQFVPNPSRSNGKDFMIVFASPELAVQSLMRMEAAGMGSTQIFQGRQEATTVGAILADDRLLTYNEVAQARIDTVKEGLIAAGAITEEDIVDVPVLYEELVFFGEDYAVAYNPGIQNLVTINQTLLVPDPEGPDENGVDTWQTMTREALEPLGLTVEFVDVYESYHINFGEAHCGTEVEHAPYAELWWERE
jgi:protein-arginine deiminase